MKLSFIGSGNVATLLAKALHKEEGVDILQIVSRTKGNAKRLAKQVSAKSTGDLSELDPNFDLLILAIKDDALSSVVPKLNIPKDKPIVHTAGSVSAQILEKTSDHFGVLYPLQTFSKNKDIDWRDVPILVSASSDMLEKELLKLASKLSARTQTVDDKQRFAIHLAAVIACNFSNATWTMASEICKRNQIAFDLLRPLIEETVSKIWEMDPRLAQTGPAVRNDQSIIQKHSEALSERPLEKEIYSLLSEYIFRQSKSKP